MRKNIWKWGLFILLLAPVMTACKDDDEDDYNFRNDPHITQTVESRYPGAQIVEVERTYQGYEVQMWLNNGEVDMHLDLNYQWLYTEFEDIAWTSVPEAVVNSFTQDGFTFNPREDDVDRIEYPNGTETAVQYRNWTVSLQTSYFITMRTEANTREVAPTLRHRYPWQSPKW